jgi:hypothetical protein
MVTSGRHERRGAGHERHELEAEHVAVEGEPPLQVANVQVDVSDHETPPGLATRLVPCDGGQQVVKIEGMWAARVVQRLGPPLAWSVGGQLDAVSVGVGQVDGFVGGVVRGALDGGLRLAATQRRMSQLLAGGKQKRIVVEA